MYLFTPVTLLGKSLNTPTGGTEMLFPFDALIADLIPAINESIANIIGSASTSTCEGFDVPISGLGGGVTKININLSDGERSGVIRGEVNI